MKIVQMGVVKPWEVKTDFHKPGFIEEDGKRIYGWPTVLVETKEKAWLAQKV